MSKIKKEIDNIGTKLNNCNSRFKRAETGYKRSWRSLKEGSIRRLS